MKSTNGKRVFYFSMVVFILATSFSVYCLVLKRDALQLDKVDYNYFIEQATRLTDPLLAKKFALNIQGYNMLGLQGIEGVRNLYHAIHNEYYRYTYALIYGIFHSTLPVFIFYCLCFFSPVLYFGWLAAKKGIDWKQVALFIALYVLFPATFNCVTDDLRPRMLYAAAWCLAALAVYFERPFPEKLLTFLLLPFVREEGILLGGVIIVFNFVRMQGKPGRWLQTLVLLCLNVLAIAAFLVFMSWGQYTRIDAAYDPRPALVNLFNTNLPLTLSLVILLALLLGMVWLKWHNYFKDLVSLLVYCSAIAMTGLPVLRMMLGWFPDSVDTSQISAWQVYLAVMAYPQTAFVFYIILLLPVLLWDYTKGWGRKLLGGFLIVLCLVFAGTTLSYFPAQMADWRQNLPAARLVWDFTRKHNRYTTNVLLDYYTYQAFYNYDKILVYNRLPLWLVPPTKSYYPINQVILARQIQKRLGYAVISQVSLGDVRAMAELARVAVEEVDGNAQYVVLKFAARP